MAQDDPSSSATRMPDLLKALSSEQQTEQHAVYFVQDPSHLPPVLRDSSADMTTDQTTTAPESRQEQQAANPVLNPVQQPIIQQDYSGNLNADQSLVVPVSEPEHAQQAPDLVLDPSKPLIGLQDSSSGMAVDQTATAPEPEQANEQQPADLVHNPDQQLILQHDSSGNQVVDQPVPVPEPESSGPVSDQIVAPEQRPTISAQTSGTADVATSTPITTADGPHVDQSNAPSTVNESAGLLHAVPHAQQTAQLPSATASGDLVDANVAPKIDAPQPLSDDSDSSDPLSSSSDDSDSDSDSEGTANARDAMSDADVDEGDVDDLDAFVRGVMGSEGKSGPQASMLTANEKEYWTSFGMPDVEVTEQTEIAELGVITSIIDGYAAVIDPSYSNVPGILNMGTPVCTKERKLLGEIGDVIASVKTPRYVWGVNDPAEFEKHGIAVNDKLFYVKGNAAWVDVPALRKLKYYDASNMNDEEIPDDKQDFSDDEAERQFKHSKKNRKRAHEPGTPSTYDGSILNYDDGGSSVADDNDDGSYRKLKRPAPGMMDQPPPPFPGRGGMPGGRGRGSRGGPGPRGGRGSHRDERRGGHPRRGQSHGQSNNNNRGDTSSLASQSPRPGSQSMASVPFPSGQPYMGQGYNYNNSPGMQGGSAFVPPPPGWPQFNPAGGMPGFVPTPPSMAGGFPQMPTPQMMAMHPYYTIPGPWNNHTLPQQQNQPYPPWWNANNNNQNNNGGQQ